MARKLRIQFPGAIYHVINRGKYRRDQRSLAIDNGLTPIRSAA